jgi:hypothetical protein
MVTAMMCGQERGVGSVQPGSSESSRIYLLFGVRETNVTFRDSADHQVWITDSKIHAEGGCKGPPRATMSTECQAGESW